MPAPPTLDDLRRYAVGRTLFRPTTLMPAIQRLGFVQADPIRAPARAQDLTLRHRVTGYCAGDLERRYASLDVEEDFFVNYGFLPRSAWSLMHPRADTAPWDALTKKRARVVLDFIRERGNVHPREVDASFDHGSVTNYWGGASNATTHLLDDMHYRGLLRVVRRDRGIRVYATHEHGKRARHAAARREQLDVLTDLVARLYAPLPAATLSGLVLRLRYAVPQHQGELREALLRAHTRLAQTRLDGTTWYWPADEDPGDPSYSPGDAVRLLAPFDPLVWDRRRFESFWGWAYRFEAYTPPGKRRWGYYALPLLWRDRVIGWGNLSVVDGQLLTKLGYVEGHAPSDPVFRRELEAELVRIKAFLRV